MSDKGSSLAGLVYLGWQCKPDQALAEGLPEALARYQSRTGQQPRALVVRQRDTLPGLDIEIVESASIAADCIGLVVEGKTEQAEGQDATASTDEPAGEPAGGRRAR